MTVKKFVNYFFLETQKHWLTAPYTAQETSFKSVCIFDTEGKLKEESIYYLFLNNTNFDKLEISDKIQHLDIKTDSTRHLNRFQKNPISAESSIWSMSNKDDNTETFPDLCYCLPQTWMSDIRVREIHKIAQEKNSNLGK